MSLDQGFDTFYAPIQNGDQAGFDVHVYFGIGNEDEVKFAKALQQAIAESFPKIVLHGLRHKPVGPHMVGMFQADIFSPSQFSALVPWLAVHRGPLSVLVHPNTGDARRDHTQNAIWMGDRKPLNLQILEASRNIEEAVKRLKLLEGD